MKFIDKENGRIFAKGRMETSKINKFKRENDFGENEILFTCEYDMANILPTSGKGGCLGANCFCVCSIGNDNLLSFEASVSKSNCDIEAVIRLTPCEKEMLLCWIINNGISIKDERD